MIKNSNYERIYTGSQINVNYLKGLLEEKDIHAVVRNDFESGLRGGFGGGIPDHVQLFVDKDHVVQAKRLTDKAFEDGVPDEILEQQAQQSRLTDEDPVQKPTKRPLIKTGKEARPKRSVLNLVLNVGLIVYSAWRLYPLLQGETLPTWRIALSVFILIFCSVTVINHFRK